MEGWIKLHRKLLDNPIIIKEALGKTKVNLDGVDLYTFKFNT